MTLETAEENSEVEQNWNTFGEAHIQTAKRVLGLCKRKNKPWISSETLERIEERNLKERKNWHGKIRAHQEETTRGISTKSQEDKSLALRARGKRKFVGEQAAEAEAIWKHCTR